MNVSIISFLAGGFSALSTGLQRRRSLADESATVLQCINVPKEFNNKSALRRHFSNYGVVARAIPTPQKHSAVIHFKDHVNMVLV